MRLSNPQIVALNVRSFFSDFPPSPNLKGWLTTMPDQALEYLVSLFVITMIKRETNEGAFALQVLASIALTLNRAGSGEKGKVRELDAETMNLTSLLINLVEVEALRRRGYVRYDYQGALRPSIISEMDFARIVPEKEKKVRNVLTELYAQALDVPEEVIVEAGIIPDGLFSDPSEEAPEEGGVPKELLENVSVN